MGSRIPPNHSWCVVTSLVHGTEPRCRLQWMGTPEGRGQEPRATGMGTPEGRRERGSPWGEAGGGAAGGERRRSSVLWLFLDLRSALAALIFLGRPRFRPAIFLPFLLSFFFRALEGDGFLTVATPAFSSSAPESWRTQAGSKATAGAPTGTPLWAPCLPGTCRGRLSPQGPRWPRPCSPGPWWGWWHCSCSPAAAVAARPPAPPGGKQGPASGTGGGLQLHPQSTKRPQTPTWAHSPNREGTSLPRWCSPRLPRSGSCGTTGQREHMPASMEARLAHSIAGWLSPLKGQAKSSHVRAPVLLAQHHHC